MSLALRHPGLAHGFNEVLALLQEDGIVALRGDADAADSEFGIEGKTGFDFGPRFIVSAESLKAASQRCVFG
jgi:hypothetical protein